MQKEDILSRFLIEREKNPENITDKYLRDIILNFVIAGRDTTAGTLSWFLYMLCKHPDVQEKIAKEVKEATNTTERILIKEFAATLTEEALNRMQYLHAALTETLRLYPAVPLVSCYFKVIKSAECKNRPNPDDAILCCRMSSVVSQMIRYRMASM